MAQTYKKYNPTTLYFPNKLQRKLSYIKDYPLTVVEAPSGFGKTTALRNFVENSISSEAAIYWHTYLEETPNAFWRAFCGIISSVSPKCGEELWDLGVPNEDTIPQVRDILENVVCLEETYIVIDNVGNLCLPILPTLLKILSEHGGEQLHIIMLMQQLSGEGQLQLNSHLVHRVRGNDFVFSIEDIDIYYRQAGAILSPKQLDEVHSITEGWVMALYLQLLSFLEEGHFESGDMQKLIQGALWDKLSEQECEFFLSVSNFNQFTLSQAVKLSGQEGQWIEKMLKEKNLFVHYNKESRHFYLHSIFADFLSERFAVLCEDEKESHYMLCGQVAYSIGDRINTLVFYHKAHAYEAIFSMNLSSYEIVDLASEGTREIIFDLIEKTPYEIKVKYPESMIPVAFSLFFLNEHKKLFALQEDIKVIIEKSSISESKKRSLQGEMELLMSFLEYNRIDEMGKRHCRALELLGGPAKLINVRSTWTFGSPSVLYMFHRQIGNLSHELELMETYMPIYYELTQGHGMGAESMMEAEAAFLVGDIEKAEILCHRTLISSDMKHQNSIYQCGLFLLARIAVLRGDKDLLRNTLQSMSERAKQHTEDLCRYTLDLGQGFIGVLLEEETLLNSWLVEGDISEKQLVIMTQPFAHMIYGRVLLMQKEYLKLLGVGEYFMAIASIFPNIIPQIYCKIYMAQALEALGKRSEAIIWLTQALEAALPDNIYMPFAENALGLKELFLLLPKSVVGEAQKCIDALSTQLQSSIKKLREKKITLTPREYQVVELVRQGMTNKEISAKLYISVSTVKTTLAHIFEKTGVNSKTKIALLKL